MLGTRTSSIDDSASAMTVTRNRRCNEERQRITPYARPDTMLPTAKTARTSPAAGTYPPPQQMPRSRHRPTQDRTEGEERQREHADGGYSDRRTGFVARASTRLGLGAALKSEQERAGPDEEHRGPNACSRADGGGEDRDQDRPDDEDQLVNDGLE